jgi:hypothetical protein
MKLQSSTNSQVYTVPILGDYTVIDVNMDGTDPCASERGILTRFSRQHWFWAL